MFLRLLGIRPAERRDASLGFAMLLAIMAGHAILETARDSLFLARLPAGFLPWTYLAMAVLTLGPAAFRNKINLRFSRRKWLSLLLFLGAGVNVAFFVLSSLAGSASTLLIFYVWTGLYATVVVVQFWLLLGDVLDLAQAKRVFTWVAAGGLLGATFGSVVAEFVARHSRAQVLLLVASGLFAGAALLPPFFTRNRKLEPARLEEASEAGSDSSVALLRRDAYLRRLLAFVLLGTIMVTGLDYVFKAVVAQNVPAPKLANFFGTYYGVINGCALLVQLVVAPLILRNVGVNRTLLVMPALLFFASLGFLSSGALAIVLLMRGVDGSLRHSVNRTATEILYLPLEPRIRGRFKTLIEAVGQRGGQALASLAILVALAYHVTLHQMGYALVGLSVAWLLCIIGLQPHYLELFRTRLRQGTIETRVDVPELDLHTLEALVAALSSDEDVEVTAALQMFATYHKLHLVPALILFHPSRAVVLQAFALFADSKRKDVLRLSARLLRHPDHEIRAAALRHYSSNEFSEATLRRCLLDESPACRATAAVGLIAAGYMPKAEAHEYLQAIIDGPSPDARQALALSLHQLPAEDFAWLAVALAQVKQAGLAALVARSIALEPKPAYLPALVLLLAQRDGRGDAREALKKMGAAALDYLERALFDETLPRSVRRHLPRTISYFGTAKAASILVDFLPKERDQAVQYKILRGLGRMRATEPTLPVPPESLLDCARSMLKHAIDVAAWQLVIDCGRARQARFDTGSAELLSALLNDYRTSAIERVFRLLHILEPAEEFARIYDGLHSVDQTVRAGSLELLEHVVPDTIRAGLLPLVDGAKAMEALLAASSFYDAPARERLAQVEALDAASEPEMRQRAAGELEALYAGVLGEMLDDHSAVLRGIVSHHVAELGIRRLQSQIRASVPGAARSSLSELTDHALALMRQGAGVELGRA